MANHKVHLSSPNQNEANKVELNNLPFCNSDEKKSTVDFKKYFGVNDADIFLINHYLKEIRNDWERKII